MCWWVSIYIAANTHPSIQQTVKNLSPFVQIIDVILMENWLRLVHQQFKLVQERTKCVTTKIYKDGLIFTSIFSSPKPVKKIQIPQSDNTSLIKQVWCWQKHHQEDRSFIVNNSKICILSTKLITVIKNEAYNLQRSCCFVCDYAIRWA